MNTDQEPTLDQVRESATCTVYRPMMPLSGARWIYYQLDGKTWVSISRPKAAERLSHCHQRREVAPDVVVHPDALEVARRHGPKFGVAEAEEVYTVLCNAARHVEGGHLSLAQLTLDHLANDCRKWARRVKRQRMEAAA